MSWQIGIDEVRRMVTTRHLERVHPNRDGADALLDAAARHLSSALLLAATDPEGAYAMLYDGARKSLTAVLLTQGLRPTTTGGHRAVQDAIAAQFPSSQVGAAFRPFNRLRQTRHQAEYEHLALIDTDLVIQDHGLVVTIHDVATRLVAELPVFTG